VDEKRREKSLRFFFLRSHTIMGEVLSNCSGKHLLFLRLPRKGNNCILYLKPQLSGWLL